MSIKRPREETHISSLVIQALPGRAKGVEESLADLENPGIAGEVISETVAVDTRQDRIILVVEAPGMRSTSAYIDAAQNLHGVLSVAMIYHHAEPSPLLEEEIA